MTAPITAEDLYRFRWIDHVRLSRDGERVAYQLGWADAESRQNRSRVVVRKLLEPEPIEPTGAPRRDHSPEWSPDGRRLAFADGAFDVAYSLSSVEHFGGLDGAIAALTEMGRVVKRGGLVAIATEYQLSGPPHLEVFPPAQVRELFDRPGLRLVEPIDEGVCRRYDSVPISLNRNPYQTPHMVVKANGTVFTSVMAFLRKQ